MTDDEWEKWLEANTSSSDEVAAAAADRIMEVAISQPERIERIVEISLRVVRARA